MIDKTLNIQKSKCIENCHIKYTSYIIRKVHQNNTWFLNGESGNQRNLEQLLKDDD